MPTYPTYKLGEICEIVYGKGFPTKGLKSEGFPVFGANGVIGFNDTYLYEESQVLISCRGAYSGKINLSPPKCWITNNSLVIKLVDSKIDRSFLYYALQAASKKDLVTGSAQPQVTINNANELLIPLPPLPTQHQIVSRIESLFAELDKAAEHLRTAQQQLKIYRQAVLNHWLNNDDGKWETVKLGEVAEAIDPEPSHRTPKIEKQGIPFISIKDCDYKTNTINFNTARLVSSSVLIEHKSRYTINEGDFIIGKIGTIGNPVNVVLPQDYALSANVVLIKATDRVNSKFLYNLFRSVIIEKQLLKGKKATTQAAFGIQKVRLLEIPLPSLSEQQRIVEEIETRLSQAEAAEARIAEALQKTEALRQSILKKAFSGELV